MSNLSIISQPPDVALIGEGLPFVLQNVNIIDGDRAYVSLEMLGDYTAYADGQYFELIFGAVGSTTTMRFTFKSAPAADSVTELQAAVSTETVADIVKRVTEFLGSILGIIQDYDVYVDQYGMVMVMARKPGSAYDVNLGSTSIFVLGIDDQLHGSDAILSSDYRVYLAICRYIDGENAEPVGEDLLNIDETFQAHTDIADYLSINLKTTFTWPFTGTLATPLAEAVLKYFIRHTEYQNAAYGKLTNTYATPLIVIPGGLNRLDSDFLKEDGSDFFSYGYNNKRFLTWSPKKKTTWIGAAERLYFLNQSGSLDMNVKRYYEDGSTQLAVFTALLPVKDTIYEIAVSTYALFSEAELQNLESYEIWLSSSNAIVSEVRTFIISYDYQENFRTLIFQNSFDMYDMLHLTGNMTISDDVKRTLIETYKNENFRKKIQHAANNPKYKLNSGYLSGRAARLWLEDMLLSKDMFLVLGDFLLPINNVTGKIIRSEDKDEIYSLSLSFEPDYDNERFSSIIGEGATYVRDENMAKFTDENGQPYIY